MTRPYKKRSSEREPADSLTDKCRALYRRTNVVQSGKWICKWFRRQPLLRDSAYVFSKSRFFLALILLGPWVRASGAAPPKGLNPYWALCTETSQINGLLNSRKFHVYRPTNPKTSAFGSRDDWPRNFFRF